MKKYAVKFIEDGIDVQALSNIDRWAESLCGVSAVRNENPDDPHADSNSVRDYQEKAFDGERHGKKSVWGVLSGTRGQRLEQKPAQNTNMQQTKKSLTTTNKTTEQTQPVPDR